MDALLSIHCEGYIVHDTTGVCKAGMFSRPGKKLLSAQTPSNVIEADQQG